MKNLELQVADLYKTISNTKIAEILCVPVKQVNSIIAKHKLLKPKPKDGYRVCYKCKKELLIDQFYTKNGKIEGICKSCNKIVCDEYRNNNHDSLIEKNRVRYQKNKDSNLANKKVYYQINRDKILDYKKQYFANNRLKFSKKLKKRREDPAVRLRHNVSCVVRQALTKSYSVKNSPTWSKLPYTPSQLKEHLERQFDSNMTWENYGSYWVIDHICPQSRLIYNNLDHPNFQKCWSLDNLQPLEKNENLKKGDKWEPILKN